MCVCVAHKATYILKQVFLGLKNRWSFQEKKLKYPNILAFLQVSWQNQYLKMKKTGK